MSSERAKTRMRTFTASALAFVFLVTGGGIAQAYWSATSTHTGSSVAGISLPAPATMSCTNLSIIIASVARVSWPAVTGATGYRVVVSRASGGTSTTIDQATRSVDLSTGVLGDLLSGLLAPTVLTVTVSPTYSAGAGVWVSPNSRSYQANAVLLPIGTTCRGPI